MFGENSKTNFIVLILILSLILFSTCSQESARKSASNEIMNTEEVITNDSLIKKEVKHNLEDNLLDVWYPRIVDKKNGGFYNKFNYKWELVSPFPKMIVSQARGVWVASRAAQRYPEKSKFAKAAQHGFKFLKNKMWDEKYGGFFFNLSSEDTTSPVLKRAYGNAFAIYALSEYYQLTGDKEAKKLAQKTFRWINKTYYDSAKGGYFEWATREGTSYANSEDFNQKLFPGDGEIAKYKDYNSTIHLLEAFTSLYKIWKNEDLKNKLTESFHIVRDTMVSEKGHLNLYYKKDWSLVSFQDSSREFIEQHDSLDHLTFGHDIETAYLLLEAGEVLGLNNDKTHRIAKSLVDHTVKYGFDENYSGIFSGGYYFNGEDSPTIIDSSKSWWPQAEGLNGLLLYSYLYPENDEYKSAFYNLWHYTKKYMIDQKYGGWFPRGIDVEGYDRIAPKAHRWKSCYHTYRALENLLEMLQTKKPIVGH